MLFKKLRLISPFLLALAAVSCVDQGPTNVPSNFYSSDPVARANGNAVVYSTNGQFDVGVALSRTDNKGTSLTAGAAVAFDKNWIPASANGATVNGISLPWLGGGSNDFLPNTFGLKDSALYGNNDSMTIGYSNFDNDYYGGTVEIAPPFGLVAPPDTVSASQGFALHYANILNTDSVQVTLAAFDSTSIDSAVIVVTFTAPDSGAVAFPTNVLPFIKDGTYLYEVELYRERFATRTSGAGKKIGIFSNYYTDITLRVKP
jgi:hypothetical protein